MCWVLNQWAFFNFDTNFRTVQIYKIKKQKQNTLAVTLILIVQKNTFFFANNFQAFQVTR